MIMHDKEASIEKLVEYADSEWPHIYFFKDDIKCSDGCVDSNGLISGNYLEEVGLDETILESENAELELCKYLLKNDYELFFSLGRIEDMSEYGGNKGSYLINDEIEIIIDLEGLFRKPKIFKTKNNVEFFNMWDKKYLDEKTYRICPGDCKSCFYCLDDEADYVIAFPKTDEDKYDPDILPDGLQGVLTSNMLFQKVEFMKEHCDIIEKIDDEFLGYEMGAYGVFIKQIEGKNLMDYGYVNEALGPVGPALDFYKLDEIECEDEVKKTFINLIDDADIYLKEVLL